MKLWEKKNVLGESHGCRNTLHLIHSGLQCIFNAYILPVCVFPGNPVTLACYFQPVELHGIELN